MQLAEMWPHDFKGIEGPIDFRPSITVYFGTNDSGKTNVLELLGVTPDAGLGTVCGCPPQFQG